MVNEIFYVYVDYTDDGRPYYVGKGTYARTMQARRNHKHTHVRQALGFTRVRTFETRNEVEAFNEERRLIKEYHTYIGDPEASSIACNFTTGGDGTSGHGPMRIGNPNYRKPKSAQMRARLSRSKSGTGNAAYGKKQSQDFIEKRISKLRGRKRSLDVGEKISTALTGKKLSGSHPHAKGKKLSDATRQKMREAQQRRRAKERDAAR